MKLKPDDMEYRSPEARGYKVSGKKMEASDPYDTKSFRRWIAESGAGVNDGVPRWKAKHIRIAMRVANEGRSAGAFRREVRRILNSYYGQEAE